jgi:hypothetical protein
VAVLVATAVFLGSSSIGGDVGDGPLAWLGDGEVFMRRTATRCGSAAEGGGCRFRGSLK